MKDMKIKSRVTAKVKSVMPKPKTGEGSLMKEPKMGMQDLGSGVSGDTRGYLKDITPEHAKQGYRSLGSAGAQQVDNIVPGQEQTDKNKSAQMMTKKPKA